MPATSVKIWQRSARRAAASATAVVSLPPRPSVVISWSMADVALWPWKPGDDDDLAALELGADAARLDAGDAGPAVRAVGGDAGLRAGQADGRDAERVEGHRDEGRALVLAGREQHVELARIGSSVMPAARPSSSSVVSPIADTTTTRSWPAARSRAIRRATRLMRSAPATDEPPNFWTTRGLGIAGILPSRFGLPSGRPASGARYFDSKVSTLTASARTRGPAMCFDHDSRPPIAPIAGGALDGALVDADRRATATAFAAFRARPGGADRCGGRHPPRRSRPPSVLRGARPALRGARASTPLAIDWFGRTAGVDARATPTSSTCRTSSGRPGPASRPTSRPPSRRCAATRLGRRAAQSVFTIGFCMGGRMSFLAATLGLDLAGVIGLYGTLVGPWRNDAPAPVDAGRVVRRRRSSGCSAGRTRASPPSTSRRSTRRSAPPGVDHRIVTYPGAPHSFFDRKAAEFADESEAAWGEILAFMEARTGRV